MPTTKAILRFVVLAGILAAALLPAVATAGATSEDSVADIPGRARSSPDHTSPPETCEEMGWAPTGFDLKEHTIFFYDGLYYMASIHLVDDDDYKEKSFVYASSPDLCNWTHLGQILTERVPGEWDEFRIWSPYVIEEGGVYYMYYTGVTQSIAQSTMLATSDDPSDPDSWVEHGVVFQPSHPDMVWPGFNDWSDCRDPMVIEIDGVYHQLYTGTAVGSVGIVGVATADSPLGPWANQGAIVTSPTAWPENATVTVHEGLYYMFYNHSPGLGEVYQYGPTIYGPWSDQALFRPGWGHEVWSGMDGQLYTSYLYDGDIIIRPVSWSHWRSPPIPIIGVMSHSILLPIVVR